MSNTKESLALDLNLGDIMITSQEGEYSLMPVGDHVVKCTGVAVARPKESAEYDDVTPQVELQLENEDGKQIRWWLNTKGFVRFDKLTADHLKDINPADLNIKKADWAKMSVQNRIDAAFTASEGQGYAINNVTRQRVVSEENTKQALDIIGKLANHCGVVTGKSLNMQQFVQTVKGATFGVHIFKNAQNQPRVKYSMPAEDVEAEA